MGEMTIHEAGGALAINPPAGEPSGQLMFSWAAKGGPIGHVGVADTEAVAIGEVDRLLRRREATVGSVWTCRVDAFASLDYVYGHRVARAELDEKTGKVVWSAQ